MTRFPSAPERGSANGKRAVIVPSAAISTRSTKAAVSTAEWEAKGDATKKKTEVFVFDFFFLGTHSGMGGI